MLFTVELDDCPVPVIELAEFFAKYDHAISSDGNGTLTVVRTNNTPRTGERAPPLQLSVGSIAQESSQESGSGTRKKQQSRP
jgi:hypothetical protein